MIFNHDLQPCYSTMLSEDPVEERDFPRKHKHYPNLTVILSSRWMESFSS